MSSIKPLSPLEVEEIKGDYPGEYWDAEGIESWNRPWVKQCKRCGRGYNLARWERLHLVIVQRFADDGWPEVVEIRDCECGSSLARELP